VSYTWSCLIGIHLLLGTMGFKSFTRRIPNQTLWRRILLGVFTPVFATLHAIHWIALSMENWLFALALIGVKRPRRPVPPDPTHIFETLN
jgi:hypothetical protein